MVGLGGPGKGGEGRRGETAGKKKEKMINGRREGGIKIREIKKLLVRFIGNWRRKIIKD